MSGRPVASASTFPGNRVDPMRAGITTTAWPVPMDTSGAVSAGRGAAAAPQVGQKLLDRVAPGAHIAVVVLLDRDRGRQFVRLLGRGEVVLLLGPRLQARE